jgi:RHS repeat-associated protein
MSDGKAILGVGDYYPFGMAMPGRRSVDGNYRYGFNDKEQDNEVSGSGNIYDYGFRVYNSRLGKFLSVDPLTTSFPWYTPYQFSGNKPIWKIDLDGLEEAHSKANVEDTELNNSDKELNFLQEGIFNIFIMLFEYQDYKQRGGGMIGRMNGTYEYEQGDEIFHAFDGISDAVMLGQLSGAVWEPGSVGGGSGSKTETLTTGLDEMSAALRYSDEVSIIARTLRYTSHQLGQMGEITVRLIYGGDRQTFHTPLGIRFVDNLADGVAYESKVGYKTADNFTQLQFEKDLYLLDNGLVDEVVWTFFKSPETGKVGASKGLLNLFEQAQRNGFNIRTQILELSEEAIIQATTIE